VKLDVRTTTLLKGLGILLIVGHNFQYLASDLPGVNEFVFERENVDSFFELLTPASFVRLTIAYLGHYGVQLFIFLSAYGLTLSFEKQSPRYGSFVRARLVRLYPAFVIAIIAWALWKGVPRGVMGPIEQLTENGRSLAWKLSLLSNLVRGEQLSLVGPWWFLPFIFQFYLVFPLLLRMQTRGLIAVSVTSLALTVLLNELVLPGGFVYATPLGHVPEFCVGIWWARTPGARVPSGLAIVALGLFLAGNW
jgi:peptidoglycan/LPS O-acetylase OafA/YrhL